MEEKSAYDKSDAWRTVSTSRQIIGAGIELLSRDTLKVMVKQLEGVLVNGHTDNARTKAARLLLEIAKHNTSSALALCKTVEMGEKIEHPEPEQRPPVQIVIDKDMPLDKLEDMIVRLGGPGGGSEQ